MCLGIPGQVLDVTDAAAHMAAVRVSGARRTVDISLVDEEGIAPGEWVLVHAGLALSKIAEAEAQTTLALLQEMSDAFMGVADASDEAPAPALTDDAPGDYAAPGSHERSRTNRTSDRRRARVSR